MNFSENLQNLRNSKNMTQEELAEKLEVSRQAVSKWESGSGYPEMEKLILICDIFDCTMDTLMKGKISLNETDDRKAYEKIYNLYSKGIAFGVGIILLGVTILVGLFDFYQDESSIVGVLILMTCILIAVPIFIYVGLSMENFQKLKPKMPNIFSDDEVTKYNQKYAIILSICVSLIIFGVILLIALYGTTNINLEVADTSVFPVTILLSIVTLTIPIIVYYTTLKGKYDVEYYNRESNPTKEDQITGKVCGVIMLSATFLFLALGFIWDLWHIAWVVFPLGGVLCGIAGTIFEK